MEAIKSKIQSQFSQLEFDEAAHTYKAQGLKYPSVSSHIHNFEEAVNWEEKAGHVARRDGKTTEQVLGEWKENNEESTDRGHRVHLFGELYPFNRNLKPFIMKDGKPCPQELAVMKFWNDLPAHIIIVSLEIRMFHPLLRYAGTSDILLYNIKDGTFIIADYKTNNDLFKNFKGKKLLAPFGHLLDCPLNKYQIQLSLYQILFEQTGYKVSQRKIIWLLKEDMVVNKVQYKAGEYVMFDAEDLTDTLRNYLSKQLN